MRTFLLRRIRQWAFVGLCGPGLAMAQGFRIDSLRLAPDGSLQVGYPGESAVYFRLLGGDTVDRIATPVGVTLGTTMAVPGVGTAGTQRFFILEKLPVTSLTDTDGDGIPDVYELLRPAQLDALNPADAAGDPDGNGQTFLQEYLASLAQTLTTVIETSPAQGEDRVAVTRETILYFSGPLAETTVLGANHLSATFGGRRILSRLELSSDRRKATLFYLEPLPASARVQVVFDAAAVTDANGRLLDADGDGIPGGVRRLSFDTLSITAIPGTAVIGHVFASELVPHPTDPTLSTNRPLAGVTITVDGAEQTLRTTTDTNGFFRLEPAPAGRFFATVDGRTAVGSQWPNGSYYPVVGKAWDAVAGRTDNLAAGTGEIYLPLVTAGTLQPVSPTASTTITFAPEVLQANPGLAGVQIAVPAGSLFSDNGTRGGRVGMAPVAPDRLPEPLPPGLELPLVITVQTDGPSNFDQPVPVRFPNLPDPVSGEVLPPGARTALISFNHDTGRWEISGSMTISADGAFAVSDPGMGIRQPGWHGTAPFSSGDGGGYGDGAGGGAAGAGSGGGGGGSSGGGSGAGTGDDDSVPPPASTSGDTGDGGGDGSDEDQSPDDDHPEPDPSGGGGGCDVGAQIALKPASVEEVVGFEPQGPGTRYQVLGRQMIRIIVPENIQLIVSGHETLEAGVNNEDHTRITIFNFPLNISVSVAQKTVRLIRSPTDEQPGCTQEILFEVVPNSGAHWVQHFAGSRETNALVSPFKENVSRFISALKAGGASVSIASTFRPQKRAYLMHYCCKLAALRRDRPLTAPPPYDPNLPDVVANCDGTDGCVGPLIINWLHLDRDGRVDRSATVAAARAMMSAYRIAFPAGFPATRHGAHRAIDMTIDWLTPTAVFKWPDGVAQPDGTTIGGFIEIPNASCIADVDTENGEIVGATFNNNCNTVLHQLGAAYGVIKLVVDPPHWSDDGR